MLRIIVLSIHDPEVVSFDHQLRSLGEVVEPYPVAPATRGYLTRLTLRIHTTTPSPKLIQIIYAPHHHDGPPCSLSLLGFRKWCPDGVIVMPSVEREMSQICEHSGVHYVCYSQGCLSEWLNALTPRNHIETSTSTLTRIDVQCHIKRGVPRNHSVIVGRVEQGTVSVGDELCTYPSYLGSVKVVSLQINHAEVDKATSGQHVGITLLNPEQVKPKQFLIRGEMESLYMYRCFVRTHDRATIDLSVVTPTARGTFPLFVVGHRGVYEGFLRKVNSNDDSFLHHSECMKQGGDGLYLVQFNRRVYLQIGERVSLRFKLQHETSTATDPPQYVFIGADVLPGEDVIVFQKWRADIGHMERKLQHKAIVFAPNGVISPHHSDYDYRVVLVSSSTGVPTITHPSLPALLEVSFSGRDDALAHMAAEGVVVHHETLTEDDEQVLNKLSPGEYQTFAFNVPDGAGSQQRWIVPRKKQFLCRSDGKVCLVFQEKFNRREVSLMRKMIDSSTSTVMLSELQRLPQRDLSYPLLYYALEKGKPYLPNATFGTKDQKFVFPNVVASTHKSHGLVCRPIFVMWRWAPEPVMTMCVLLMGSNVVSLPKDIDEASCVFPTIMSFCYPVDIQGEVDKGYLCHPPKHVVKQHYCTDISVYNYHDPIAKKSNAEYKIDRERNTTTASYHWHIPTQIPGESRLLWKHPTLGFCLADVPSGSKFLHLRDARAPPFLLTAGINNTVSASGLKILHRPGICDLIMPFLKYGVIRVDYILRAYPFIQFRHTRSGQAEILHSDSESTLIALRGCRSLFHTWEGSIVRAFYVPGEGPLQWSLKPPPVQVQTCEECGQKESIPDLDSTQVHCVHVHKFVMLCGGQVLTFESELPFWASNPSPLKSSRLK